ncbi:hypothetical protein ACIBP6_16410 [Nonomuraea terrae]|uniref:hypothetical protein n=1 Tax=Nonomuraea terrae TaxID=2530383 RepID=UPI0037BCF429
MTTNIGTQQELPKATWRTWMEGRLRSPFKGSRAVKSTLDIPSPAIEKNAAEDPLVEIKAALQRIEDTLLRRTEPTPTTTAEHHLGEMLLAYVEDKRWNQLWAHKLLEDPEGKAEEHSPGARLLAHTVLKHHHVINEGQAATFKRWAERGEVDPPIQDPGPPPSVSSA